MSTMTHYPQFTGYQFNISEKQQILGNTCEEVLVLAFLVLFYFSFSSFIAVFSFLLTNELRILSVVSK